MNDGTTLYFYILRLLQFFKIWLTSCRASSNPRWRTQVFYKNEDTLPSFIRFSSSLTKWIGRNVIKSSAFGTNERCGHFSFLERKMLPVCTIGTSESPEWTNERACEGTVYLRNLNTTASSINFKRKTHFCRCYIYTYTYICKASNPSPLRNSQRKFVIHNYISKIIEAFLPGISECP